MKIKTSPAKPHSYWTFCERHMKRIFWLFGNGARTLTACRKLVETARRCEGVYKRQESRARLFAKEEEQRHECAPIFIQKSEQAIQSLLRRGGEGGIRTHVPGIRQTHFEFYEVRVRISQFRVSFSQSCPRYKAA